MNGEAACTPQIGEWANELERWDNVVVRGCRGRMAVRLRKAFKRLGGTRTLLAAAAATALGVVLAVMPLTDVLGYESSAVCGALLPLIAAVIWFGPTGGARGRTSPAARWGTHATQSLGLAILPLLVLLGNALRVKNCDVTSGLAYYALIVGGSLALTATWATLVSLLTHKAWLRWALFVALWLATWVNMGLFLALEPPIVAYHPLIGYFAGSIYDESLSVPGTLVLYRAYHVLVVIAVLTALEIAARRARGEPWSRASGLVAALLAALAASATLMMFRAELGLEVDRETIQHELGRHYETEHFAIHYSPSSWHRDYISTIGEDHEFRYAQLQRRFGSEPLGPGEKIDVYLYPSAREKQRLMGSGRTMVAKLWLREIHVLYPSLGYPVLAHELAHVFSAPYGTGPLSLSTRGGLLPNMGLVEGLAEATTVRRSALSLHEWSAAMRKLGIAADVRVLVGPTGFYGTAGVQAYTLAGSFCRFLIDTYGMDHFLDAYGDGDFQRAYGRDLDSLVSEWESFVDAIEVQDDVLPVARYTFDRRSIFHKVCARRVAFLSSEASRLSGLGFFDEALSCRREVIGYTGGDPAQRIALAHTLLLAGDVRGVVEETTSILALPELPRHIEAGALSLRGDASWALGDLGEARRDYRAAHGIGLPLAARRLVSAKEASLDSAHGRGIFFPQKWQRSLVALRAAGYVADDPESALAEYLLGRQLWSTLAYAEAIVHLERALSKPAPLPDPMLTAETLRLLGISQFVTGDAAGARHSFEAIVEAHVPNGVRDEAKEWLERLDLHRAAIQPG